MLERPPSTNICCLKLSYSAVRVLYCSFKKRFRQVGHLSDRSSQLNLSPNKIRTLSAEHIRYKLTEYSPYESVRWITDNMLEEDIRSRIRDHDWIFNALWVSCGNKRLPKCSINIPLTVLFHDGLPFKALETNIGTGCIERLDLDHERFIEREVGEIGFQGINDRSLRALRKVLIEFGDLNEFLTAQSSAQEVFVAKVN